MSEIELKKSHHHVHVQEPNETIIDENKDETTKNLEKIDETEGDDDKKPKVNGELGESNNIVKIRDKKPSVMAKRKQSGINRKSNVSFFDETILRKSRNMMSINSRSESAYTMTGRLIRPRVGQRIYQPTYRLESKLTLNLDRVETIMREVIQTSMINIDNRTYHPIRSPKLAQELSFEIKFRTKVQSFDRIRLIIIVTIIEKFFQSCVTRLGFIWGKDEDNWTSYEYDSDSIYLHAIAFGVYFD